MSRWPSRLETKYKRRPSGDHVGLIFSETLSDTATGSPPPAGVTVILLGPVFPMLKPIFAKSRGVVGEVRLTAQAIGLRDDLRVGLLHEAAGGLGRFGIDLRDRVPQTTPEGKGTLPNMVPSVIEQRRHHDATIANHRVHPDRLPPRRLPTDNSIAAIPGRRRNQTRSSESFGME
jgi:hypothetical protein